MRLLTQPHTTNLFNTASAGNPANPEWGVEEAFNLNTLIRLRRLHHASGQDAQADSVEVGGPAQPTGTETGAPLASGAMGPNGFRIGYTEVVPLGVV